MIDLTPLTLVRRAGVSVWLNAIRGLLPQGLLWNWPLTGEGNMEPFGIPTQESFGVPTLIGAPFVYPAGIPSGGAFGMACILRGVVPVGIDSGEAFGVLVASNIPFRLRDDFESGVYNPYWSSEFRSNWELQHKLPENKYVAVRGDDGDDRLTPTGVGYTGDFEVYTAIYRSASEGGNLSVHILIMKYSNNSIIADLTYNAGHLYGINGGSNAVLAGPSYTEVKITRTSGVITCSAYLGGQWKDVTQWSTPGGVINNSDEMYLKVNGARDNGIDFIDFTAANVVNH